MYVKIFWHIINSVIFTLILLKAVYSEGPTGGALGSSLVIVSSCLGVMTGSIIWSRFVSSTENYKVTFVLGFVTFFFSSIGIYYYQAPLTLAAIAFVTQLLSISTYYGSVFLANKAFRTREKGLSELEIMGGYGSIFGMVLTSVLLTVITIRDYSLVLAGISIIGIVFSWIILKIRVDIRYFKLKRYAKKLIRSGDNLKEFRLLLLIEKIAGFTKVNEKKMSNVFTTGIGHVVKGNFGIGPWKPIISLPKKHIRVQIATLIMFIALGLFFSQIYTVMVYKGLDPSFVFLYPIFSALAGIIGFKKAGKKITRVIDIVKSNILRTILGSTIILVVFIKQDILYEGKFFIKIILIDYEFLLILLFCLIGLGFGVTRGYVLVGLGSIFLKEGQKSLGINNFLKQLGIVTGSLFSGLFVPLFDLDVGFTYNYIIFMFFMFVSAIILFTDRERVDLSLRETKK